MRTARKMIVAAFAALMAVTALAQSTTGAKADIRQETVTSPK
jgi:uncharacterized PurR-regulated membrane protein YhhQ (DUF165 family)